MGGGGASELLLRGARAPAPLRERPHLPKVLVEPKLIVILNDVRPRRSSHGLIAVAANGLLHAPRAPAGRHGLHNVASAVNCARVCARGNTQLYVTVVVAAAWGWSVGWSEVGRATHARAATATHLTRR